jgi:hypothetical protein
MAGDIVPIQTRYAGCLFRSRLEARWAVFFDQLAIPWRYEYEGYDLGEEGPYLPDFLLYPDTPTAMWFEVKGKLPDSGELAKARALSAGTGLPAFVYFAEFAVPAPEHLAEMSYEEFVGHQDMWMWDDIDGWIASPSGPARWEVGLRPTAFRFNPRGQDRARKPKSGFWWWTDCPYCGRVILKYRGQVGWCPIFDDDHEPPQPHYPRFAHATGRLQAAYTAARSARFEHGAHGTS